MRLARPEGTNEGFIEVISRMVVVVTEISTDPCRHKHENKEIRRVGTTTRTRLQEPGSSTMFRASCPAANEREHLDRKVAELTLPGAFGRGCYSSHKEAEVAHKLCSFVSMCVSETRHGGEWPGRKTAPLRPFVTATNVTKFSARTPE